MNTVLQIRIDERTKKAARKAFVCAGLDLSSGIKLYLAQVANSGKVPFEAFTFDNVSQERKETILTDMRHAAKHGKRYATAREAISDMARK